MSPWPTATSLSSMQSTTISSGARPWRSVRAVIRPPLARGFRYYPRHPSQNTPQDTPLPAGVLKSYLRVYSAAARRLPRPAPPCSLLDTVAISAALMTHLGNALKAECFLGPTSVSQMKMLCILASTSAAMCYGPPSRHDKTPTLVGRPRSITRCAGDFRTKATQFPIPATAPDKTGRDCRHR